VNISESFFGRLLDAVCLIDKDNFNLKLLTSSYPGAVSLETGKFAYSLCETFDAKTFEMFLKLLLRRRTRGKRMVIVLDNARYHQRQATRTVVAKASQGADPSISAAYSPQLAPIERAWKPTRRLATHNRYFETLGEVLTVVLKCFV